MRVFISYGHDKHVAFARQLAKAFQELSYEVWFDEERLKSGVLWESYIEEGLKWAVADERGKMILIMTPHSVRRPEGFCLNELAYALDLHLPVLPIMLVWTTPPLSIYRYQWLDLTHRDGDVSFREDFKKILAAIEEDKQLITDTNLRLERLLNPLDYSNDLVLYQPSFVGREWLFKDLDNWLKDTSASRVFFITGAPGIGKTAIMVKMLQRYDAIIAFHLFRRGHSEKTSIRRVLCSIAFQLSKQLPDYKEQLQRIDISNELNRCNDQALLDVLIIGPLHRCEVRDTPNLILFDALDESGDIVSAPFARFVATMVRELPSWVRLVITSRPIETVLLPLKQFSPRVIMANSNENLADIEKFVESRFTETSGEILSVCNEIVKRSAGIFLYAKYVLDEWTPRSLNALHPELLPDGITAIYYDFFSERYQNIHEYRATVRPVLELLCAQVEPLTLRQIGDCLGGDDERIEDFLATCSSFFMVDSHGKVRPFHTSILDWLTSKESAGRYFVNSQHGTSVLATWLYELFEKSGWEFFREDEQSEMLYTWFPVILEQTDAVEMNPTSVLTAYLLQIKNRSILKDLVADRKRFHFIKSVLSYVFKHTDSSEYILEDSYSYVKTHILENTDNVIDINESTEERKNRLLRRLESHYTGIKYLYNTTCKRDFLIPTKKERDYLFFIDVQLPLFYVQSSFDAEYTFGAMAYGLLSAFEDGRISAMHGILSEIYELATGSFSDNDAIAEKQLEHVAQIMRDEGWDDGMWANRVQNCAKSIRMKNSKGSQYP